MLPGLIAARVLLSKVGAAPGRYPVRRPAAIRRPTVQTNARRLATTSSRSKRIQTPVSEEESDVSDIDQKPKIAIDSTGEWIPIYRYKNIRIFGTISRLKIIQTAFVVGLVPVGYYLYQSNSTTMGQLQLTMAVAGFALVMLYFMSAIFRRTIGVVSIAPDRSRIRIGYLTFWGFRRNLVIPLDDVVPLGEANAELGPGNPIPPYAKLKRYTDDKFYLYLPLWKIDIVDRDSFQHVFGMMISAKKNR